MTEYTERQQKEMIEQAKAGDPEANYRLSMWALDQAAAEPDEERWNRLAAKCLVKAAEAGYGPAKEKMDELLAQTAYAEKREPESAPEPVRIYEPETSREPEPKPEPVREIPRTSRRKPAPAKPAGFRGVLLVVLAALGNFFRVVWDKLKAFFVHLFRKDGPLDIDKWDKAKWKRVQIICIAVCVVLAVLIVILVIGGRNKAAREAEVVPTPITEVAATAVPSPTPGVTVYPDEATRAAIAAATLDTYPAESEYVTEPRTMLVATNGGTLNLRRGTSADTDWLASMPYHTELPTYAFHSGWALVDYNGTFGWASVDYLSQAGE